MFAALWGGALMLASGAVFGLAAVAAVAFVGERLVSIAHSWSTTWMVLGSPLLAAERRRRRLEFIWIPLAITLGAFALGLYVAGWQRFPASGALGPGLWPFALYISLFWVLHFWHFGNQDFGVLSLYRGRAGQLRPLDRKVDKLYTVAMMFVPPGASAVTTPSGRNAGWSAAQRARERGLVHTRSHIERLLADVENLYRELLAPEDEIE